MIDDTFNPLLEICVVTSGAFELHHANALLGLADAFPPAGVYIYFRNKMTTPFTFEITSIIIFQPQLHAG
ncbi:hypothetical protein [Virgibacillus pantothenticus]|uniref:hypothetical protein n=1 Tax=Virgibacillus pantothenticus TaxID=1473 RepID=UPI001C245943|nr:hypothetical protein [Virgibacillus pantothenticus]